MKKKYTAVFTSRTGPGLAHVESHDDHQIAWSAIAAKYLKQGDLTALIPGHHSVIMSGATLHKRSEGESSCSLVG